MKTIVLFLTLFSSLSLANPFPTSRSYRHLVGNFSSAEECENYKKESGHWFNCFQKVNFEPDGTATVLLTDIMNLATYSLTEDNRIVIEATTPGDAPDLLTFKIISDKELEEQPHGAIWTLIH